MAQWLDLALTESSSAILGQFQLSLVLRIRMRRSELARLLLPQPGQLTSLHLGGFLWPAPRP